jgi:2-aminophenol/2-amino-5-chlorophenol 1,6-dioxygenase alpha subunit
MPVVSAFLVHGNPLPYLRPDNPPWRELDAGYRAAGAALAASRPDVIAVYSTQWFAVLDELWQMRKRSTGVHVDENWHEYGDLPFDIRADVALTKAVIAATPALGVRSKPVDYDAFPIDTGTIVANNYLNPGGKLRLVIASNNLYHDGDTTAKLARAVVACADKLERRVAVVGVGGLSGTIFREEIELAADHIASAEDDAWNRRMLKLLCAGDPARIRAACPKYARAARVDMGFKHLAWVLGAIDDRYAGAVVHAYAPTYGSGAAVVEFKLAPERRRQPARRTRKAVARRTRSRR